MSTRQSRRKRSRAKHRREKMRQFSREFTKGGEYSVLVFGLLGCLAGTLVTFFADDTAYAVMLLLLGLFVGAALWKREAA